MACRALGGDGPLATPARVRCKEKQENQSKIAWICLYFFGQIWTFQRVARKKIKKSGPIPTRLSGCATAVSDGHPTAALRSSSCIFGHPSKEGAFHQPCQLCFRHACRKQNAPGLFLRLTRIALRFGIGNLMSVFLKFPRPVRMLGSSWSGLADASCSRGRPARSDRPLRSHDRSQRSGRRSANILNDYKMIPFLWAFAGLICRITR